MGEGDIADFFKDLVVDYGTAAQNKGMDKLYEVRRSAQSGVQSSPQAYVTRDGNYPEKSTLRCAGPGSTDQGAGPEILRFRDIGQALVDKFLDN